MPKRVSQVSARAHLDLVDAGGFEHVERVLVEHLAGRQQHFLRLGVQHLDGRDAAEDAVAQDLDDLAAFDQRAHGSCRSACRSRPR